MGKLGSIRWAASLPALLAVLFAGCQSGGNLPEPQLAVDVPADLVAGETAAWTVSWENFGGGPYTVAMNLGGGTTADLAEATATASPFSYSFTPAVGDYAQGQSYAYTVTVTDGSSGMLSSSGSYEVYTPPPGPPKIDAVLVYGSALTVTVNSPAEVPLTVTVTEPPGLMADSESKVVEGGSGEAVFYWSATDIIAGGAGQTTITVSDDYGGTDTATAEIDLIFEPIGAGTLTAIPAATEVKVNEPVMIVVVSSWFPYDAPFAFMDLVSVTFDEGVEFIEGSINIGAPGGEENELDGLWAYVNPPPTGFQFVNPDYFFPEHQWVEPLGNGRVMISFNLTPIGGGETSEGGALFNFQIKCTKPGTYTLGFEQFHDVKRTYYSDSEGNEYYWEDISNDYPGVPNSITVVAP